MVSVKSSVSIHQATEPKVRALLERAGAAKQSMSQCARTATAPQIDPVSVASQLRAAQVSYTSQGLSALPDDSLFNLIIQSHDQARGMESSWQE